MYEVHEANTDREMNREIDRSTIIVEISLLSGIIGQVDRKSIRM